MWTTVLALFISKTAWIFIFIVLYITVFVIIANNNGREELKERILDEGICIEVATSNENRDNMDAKLGTLAEKLTEKERMLKQSKCEIKSVEKALNDIENKTWSYRNHYKALMSDLKVDVHKTEEEIGFLQSQVSNLSRRREELKMEVTKQQEEHEKMLIQFTKDLENKGAGCVSSCERSRFSIYKTPIDLRLRTS